VPIYKVTWEYNSNNGSEWTEIYYTEDDNAVDAANPGQPLINARLNLLHPLNNLIRIRAANVVETRDTAFFPINSAGTAPGAGGPAIAGAAAICLLASPAGGTRRVWLRGIPGFWVTRSGITGADAPPAALVVALGAWFLALQNAGYGLLIRSRIGTDNVEPFKVDIVDGTGGMGVSILTTHVAHNFNANSQVYLGKFSKKDLPALQGTFSVITVPTPTTFTVLYNTPSAQKVNVASGYAKLLIFSTVNVIGQGLCAFENFGTRATHVPLFHSRGARRAARLRPSL
jgi:hypothetical protein